VQSIVEVLSRQERVRSRLSSLPRAGRGRAFEVAEVARDQQSAIRQGDGRDPEIHRADAELQGPESFEFASGNLIELKHGSVAEVLQQVP
jgi:hypothetical protein